MKPIISLFGGTLVILLMVATMSGITGFRSSAQTATYDETTAAGVTTANLTLTLAVLDNNLSNITSVTSNNTADTPRANSYTSASKKLNVIGLEASDTRRLTVVYRTPSLDDYTGVDIVAKWWPLFLAFGVLAIIIAAVVKAFQGAE